MKSTPFKIVAFGLLLTANIAFVVWLRGRRHNPLPVTRNDKSAWQPLVERTSDGRAQVLDSAFALPDFDVKPLAAESDPVTIPRPKKWFEEMLLSTSYVNAPAEVQDSKTTQDPKSKGSKSPWGAGLVRLDITSISLASYETATTPETDQLLIKEKIIGRDTYLTKDGVPQPVSQFFAVGHYYVDPKENRLLKSHKAIQVDGKPRAIFQVDIPQWLLPMRKLGVGETWTQVGAQKGASRPKVVRTLKRLVMFEGRRAAEISSLSTVYDVALSPTGARVSQHEKEGLTYLDLQTGEPLWYEAKAKDDPDSTFVVRGCNQILKKHLIRIPKPSK